MVLLKQPKSSKLATPFDPRPYQVLKHQGSSVTLQRGQEIDNVDSPEAPASSDEEDDVEGQTVAQGPAVARNMRPVREQRPRCGFRTS